METDQKLDCFINVRVRLQRTSDAKFFSGWVRGLSERDITIDFAANEWFTPGTKFFLSISGVDSTAMLTAEVIQQTSGVLRMAVIGPVKFAKATEEARKAIVGLIGTILLGDVGVEMHIHDVSAKGMGGVIEGAIARGRMVDFDVDTPHGSVIGKAEVRYCRPEEKDSVRHRIGLKIVSMGRVESTRWLRLSDDNAA